MTVNNSTRSLIYFQSKSISSRGSVGQVQLQTNGHLHLKELLRQQCMQQVIYILLSQITSSSWKTNLTVVELITCMLTYTRLEAYYCFSSLQNKNNRILKYGWVIYPQSEITNYIQNYIQYFEICGNNAHCFISDCSL